MKKININTILWILLVSLTLAGCSGAFDTFQEEEILSGEINTFLTKVNPESERFVIKSNESYTLVNQDNHIIHIAENTFPDGSADINLAYRSIETVGDLILNNTTTSTGRDILFIESVMSLDAMTSEKVINANQSIEILKPKQAANPDRTLFKSIDGQWRKVDNIDNQSLEITAWETNSQTLQSGYRAQVATNQTFAIAKPLNLGNEEKTPICVSLSEGLNGTNTNVYLQLKYSTNLISLFWNSENMLFCDGFGDVIPVGLEAKLISVSHHYDGRILFGTKSVFIESDVVYELSPKEVSEAELKSNLRVL